MLEKIRSFLSVSSRFFSFNWSYTFIYFVNLQSMNTLIRICERSIKIAKHAEIVTERVKLQDQKCKPILSKRPIGKSVESNVGRNR